MEKIKKETKCILFFDKEEDGQIYLWACIKKDKIDYYLDVFKEQGWNIQLKDQKPEESWFSIFKPKPAFWSPK